MGKIIGVWQKSSSEDTPPPHVSADICRVLTAPQSRSGGDDFIGFFTVIQFADAPESRMMQSINFQ
jgi:hypothetical protein